jgi:monofunctional biosynthetic peptidoglycan transglycosylase
MRTYTCHLGVGCLAMLALTISTSNLLANTGARVLFDFDRSDTANKWRTVNDGVMGGVSDGRFRVTDQGCLEFYGTLSLQNNGGFASVRSRPAEIRLHEDDVIVARVRGDGRRYYLNLRVPTNRTAYSYRASFQTNAGQWQEIRIPVRAFQATSYGRRIPNASPVNVDNVNSVGFLLADKIPGEFTLTVDFIKVVSVDSSQ